MPKHASLLFHTRLDSHTVTSSESWIGGNEVGRGVHGLGHSELGLKKQVVGWLWSAHGLWSVVASLLWDVVALVGLLLLRRVGDLLDLVVEDLLVGGGVAIEVDSLVLFVSEALIASVSDSLEAGQSGGASGVDVHVVDLRWLDQLLLSSLGDFLLVHLQFLLVLLHTHVHTVNQNISVDDLRRGQSDVGLLIAEATRDRGWQDGLSLRLA